MGTVILDPSTPFIIRVACDFKEIEPWDWKNGPVKTKGGTIIKSQCVSSGRNDYRLILPSELPTREECGGKVEKFIQTMSSLIEKFKLMGLSEPQKTFRKAGITRDDGSLTDTGQVLLSAWLLRKFGEEFKTDTVDLLLAEKDKEDKES